MTQTVYDYMAIPEKCLLNKPLFKKLFQEHADLDITDKKALKDDIDKIRWVYTLKPSTLNIEPYRDDVREYDEIAIIQIDLTSAARAQRIAAFVNKAIPYPVVIIFSFADTMALSVADKRINQADKSKWVIEDAWMTAWFNPDAPNEAQQKFMQDMTIKSLSFVNFYAFYTDIKNRIIALNTADRSGSYTLTSGDGMINRADSLRQLDRLEQEKAELQNKLAKEKQMGRQVEMTTRIKKMADQINGLKERL
ncbi:MAG: DUF4391 domain-containing protein [Alphaproteobacteria bacterium CG_4_9_14_3_um_filter_47_13]|nr:MAG: DUF4391 domain-containing protein [Alphaproteobacteria bacterium CG_4_9_14_3_um_filter_47_13]